MRRAGFFTRLSKRTAAVTGHPATFIIAVASIAVWAVTGPLMRYSDTWQLIINTYTDIVIFLMVFLIQNTQNRNNQTIQIKLNDMLRATHGAHTVLLNIEELSDEELLRMHTEYLALAAEAREALRRGHPDKDIGQPDVHLE